MYKAELSSSVYSLSVRYYSILMFCKEIFNMEDWNGLLKASQQPLKEKQGFCFLFCSGFVFVFDKDICTSEFYHLSGSNAVCFVLFNSVSFVLTYYLI